jgi:hypothetical protein
MITCEHCGKVYQSNVTPLHCRCGGVTGYVEPTKPVRPNPWHILHMRYAAAIAGLWSETVERNWLDVEFSKLIPCGSCGGKWLEIRPQLDLSTPEAAFAASWRLHNVVSTEHLEPPKAEITWEQCQAIYLGTQRVDRNCVVTLATGPAVEILEISKPSIQAYAERCNADYIELRGTTEAWWGLEKFRVRNIARSYNRTLFLDCDVIVRDDCPDLFAMVPQDHVAMHDDWPHLEHFDWLKAERQTVFDSQAVEGSYPEQALNTGVVLCSREHADIWTRPIDPFPTSHCAEQIWIEHLAREYPVFKLPTELNCQWWMNDFEQRKPSSHVIHWANCKNKSDSMRGFLLNY